MVNVQRPYFTLRNIEMSAFSISIYKPIDWLQSYFPKIASVGNKM